MKQHLKLLIKMWGVIVVLMYLIISFTVLQLNPLKWSQEARFAFAILAIVFMVLIMKYDELEHKDNASEDIAEDEK